ncbi:hypothetical protein [Streptomyces sp. R41]|uniref:Uncharacterized protein n=1 Tax=Streptomyces sp. R41 TaxID=3238632 RepID=A0AB39RL74_9ACTN
MGGISYTDDGDVNLAGVDMSVTSDSKTPRPKAPKNGSAGRVNNGVIGKNVTVTNSVMGSNNTVDNRRQH